ncbi:MAG: hypothetical protein WC875_02575 [Candidatus Absconditabacterales bacterium]
MKIIENVIKALIKTLIMPFQNMFETLIINRTLKAAKKHPQKQDKKLMMSVGQYFCYYM